MSIRLMQRFYQISSDKLKCTCSSDTCAQPRVGSVSQEELMVLSNCISRWKSNVQDDIDRYEMSVKGLHSDLQQTYDHHHLQQVTTLKSTKFASLIPAIRYRHMVYGTGTAAAAVAAASASCSMFVVSCYIMYSRQCYQFYSME